MLETKSIQLKYIEIITFLKFGNYLITLDWSQTRTFLDVRGINISVTHLLQDHNAL